MAPVTSANAPAPRHAAARLPHCAIAEDHGAGLLHYDQDFDRLATHTDLAVALEPLVPLGSVP
jgi:hypothetical protein